MAWNYPGTYGSETIQFDTEWNAEIVDSIKWLGQDADIGARSRSGALSISHGTNTTLNFDGTIVNQGGIVTAGTTRLTAQSPGIHYVQASLKWGGSAGSGGTGGRFMWILQNGSLRIAEFGVKSSPSGTATTTTCSTMARFNANDYVELVVLQTSGVSQPLDVNSYPAFFSMTWMRRQP